MSFILQSSTSVQSPSWTAVTASQAAAGGVTYFVDTSSAAITMTLPASPDLNSAIQFLDAKGTWARNNLTINPSGKTIMGDSTNLICSSNSQGFGIVYNGADWRIF